MTKLFENEILNNWGGIKVLANIEEAAEDARVAIEYDDHGDDFIFVRTKDGKDYEYGYFVNRKFEPDIDKLDLPAYKNYFVRKPVLYMKEDHNSLLANEIYFHINNRIEKQYTIRTEYIKEYSSDYAQRNFDDIMIYFEEQRRKNIRFDKNSIKGDIAEYLKINRIDTEENLKRLSNAKFDTRIEGADGVAGKRDYTKFSIGFVTGDSVNRIIINGKEKDPKRISMKRYYDDDMFERFGLSLGQFR